MFLDRSNDVRRTLAQTLTLCAATCLLVHPGNSQSSSATGPEWVTGSADQQRDAWQRGPSRISPKTAKDVQLLWKVRLDNKTMGMQSFREPLIVSGVKTAAGVKTVAVLVGAFNDVSVLDVTDGTMIWNKHLKWNLEKEQTTNEGGGGFICTNAQTSTPVVSPAGSSPRLVYVLASDGYLHSLDVATGDEPEAAIQMLPRPYGKPYALNLVNNVIDTITGQGCGGVPNGVYAVNLANKKVSVSSPPQAGLWGVAGAAVSSDGTIFFESGDGKYDAANGFLSTSVEAFRFANDTLTLKDYYSPTNHEWLTRRDLDMNSSPVIFPHKGRELMVGSGKEGRFFLMDTASLGGADHQTPLYRSPLISNKNVNFQTEGTWGSMASWLGKDGTRWVLAPTGGEVAVPFPISYGPTPNGGVIAMKLTDHAGKLELVPGWMSHDMMTAEPPVIVNGVVVEIAGGEFTRQADDVKGGLYSANERISKSVPGKLFLLDAVTGKELYSSGDQITSFLHQAGPSVAGDKIIFGTFDGTIYCFGLK